MKGSEQKGIHDGHRGRLVDLAYNASLENLSEVQAVELFLTYIFPRGDVNPLAHKLLDKYNNFISIFDATVSDLASIKGISEHTAKKILLFKDFFFYYTTSRMGKKIRINCRNDILDLVEDNLRFRNVENYIMFALSASNIVTHKRRVESESSTSVGIDKLEIANFIASTKAVALVIAHVHPYGSAQPSKEDKIGFSQMNNICNACGVCLLDSFIVGEDGIYSSVEDKVLRQFYDIEDLSDAFRLKIN